MRVYYDRDRDVNLIKRQEGRDRLRLPKATPTVLNLRRQRRTQPVVVREGHIRQEGRERGPEYQVRRSRDGATVTCLTDAGRAAMILNRLGNDPRQPRRRSANFAHG
jgi:hypothetical protein